MKSNLKLKPKSNGINRLKLLNKKIETLFSEADPFNPALQNLYQEYRIEMFQVMQITEYKIELMHLFEDKIFSPVIIDKPLALLLQKHDTFLLGIGRIDRSWYISYMSSAYN